MEGVEMEEGGKAVAAKGEVAKVCCAWLALPTACGG